MSIKKQYLKTKNICKVTFTLDTAVAKNAKKAFVVGEFNNWNEKASPLKKLKNGNFKTTIDLEKGKEFQFKYLIDGVWANDDKADAYVPNEFSEDNSIVVTK